MHLGDRHLHRRRALGKPKVWIDKIIFIFGVAGPILTLPQVYKIWHYHTAAGVSAFSWAAMALISILWIMYGLVHKDKPITYTYILWLFINSAVAIGAIIYSK